MIDISIPIIIWGESYIKNFEEFTYKNLELEINENNGFYESYLINLIICTKKESFQRFTNIIQKKNIKLTLYDIDVLIHQYEKGIFDKYLLLKAIQQGIFYKYKNEGIFILLYPDFIWKLGSLKFVIEKIINYKVVLAYCPQSISENLELYEFEKKFLTDDFEDYLINNLHPIVTNNEFNNSRSSFSTGATIIQSIEKGFIFRNFHLHPIAIDLKKFQNYDFLNPITVSLDEDFMANLNLGKNDYYIPQNSNQMIFSSLLGLNEIDLPQIQKNNYESYYNWVELYAQKIHIEFSKNSFLLKKNQINENSEIYKKIELLFEYIYKKLKGSNLSKFNSKDYMTFIARQVKNNKYSLNLKFFLNVVHYRYKIKILNKDFVLNLEDLNLTNDEDKIVKTMINLFYK